MVGAAIIAIASIIFILYIYDKKQDAPPSDSGLGQSTQSEVVVVEEPMPPVIHGTTPYTFTADYEFNIESDGPVRLKFQGRRQTFDFVPGTGCVQFPEHRSGPVQAWSPNDSAGGKVNFRIYPVKGEACK